MLLRFLLCSFLVASTALGQNGDKAGEAQVPLLPHLEVPPAPPLSVEDALKTFKIPPGFKIEIVASEPLIQTPVSMAWDADGKLWVLEMRGFMPNPDGKGENEPLGRVSVLEDTNGDGRMDKTTIFVDGLVMARAIGLANGGLLVAEPPHLWFFKDTDGDGKSDQKAEISNDYGSQENPEHTSNGLMYGLDNWYYSANHTIRYKFSDGKWIKEPTAFRGQWGITQDDFGRAFYNSNSDQIRADFVPSSYLARNPFFRANSGINVQLQKDQAVFPIRVNPGVNRGYQKGQLRPDGTLATFTGACGPVVYRGDNFPSEYYGAAFLCEPTGNIIRCNRLTEREGQIQATNAFPNAEFLASTDERFRPVNLFNGPDGGLYVVDISRGIIQHRIYLTTYLRNQALSRGLEKPIDQGRIYRIRHEGKPLVRQLPGEKTTSVDLAARLKSNNGWTRDTTQRLLVERKDATAIPAIKAIVGSDASPIIQVQALWTLEGMGALDEATVGLGLRSQSPKVQVHSLRAAEYFLKKDSNSNLRSDLFFLASEGAFEVQLQALLTLGELSGSDSEESMGKIVHRWSDVALIRDAAISGLGGREVSFLKRLTELSEWKEKGKSRDVLIQGLARSVTASGKSEQIDQLLAVATPSGNVDWRTTAVVEGILSVIPPTPKGKAEEIRPIRLKSGPVAMKALVAAKDPNLQGNLERLNKLLIWPGKEGVEALAEVKPLTADEQKQFDAGKELYAVTCGACHQPHGLGQEGLAPPLADAEWVTGSKERLVRIVLNGVRGKINVKGKQFELEMPPLNVLEDEQIAQLLTYVRREWGHTASPVSTNEVAKIRATTMTREEAWTEKELLELK